VHNLPKEDRRSRVCNQGPYIIFNEVPHPRKLPEGDGGRSMMIEKNERITELNQKAKKLSYGPIFFIVIGIITGIQHLVYGMIYFLMVLGTIYLLIHEDLEEGYEGTEIGSGDRGKNN
jgi:hypothetical protein